MVTRLSINKILIMKKILLLAILLVISIFLYAQQDVTKFLGIPVDGSKTEMIQKLKAKGYKYNNSLDYLEGEFNGRDVRLHIVTNNNKVWRIMIEDAVLLDETNIKIRFNKLCRQFLNRKEYVQALLSDYTLPEDEDISYEITVHKKRYEAAYYQLSIPIDSVAIAREMQSILLEKYTEEQLANLTEELQKEIQEELMALGVLYMQRMFSNKLVWFMIDEQYGRYRILMFYDNEYNHSNGEDL